MVKPIWDTHDILVKKNKPIDSSPTSPLPQNGIFTFHYDEVDDELENKATLLTIPRTFELMSKIKLNEGFTNIEVDEIQTRNSKTRSISDRVEQLNDFAGQAAAEHEILGEVSNKVHTNSKDDSGFFKSTLSRSINTLNNIDPSKNRRSVNNLGIRAGPLHAVDTGVINTARLNNFLANYYLDNDANQEYNVSNLRMLDFNLDDAQNRRYQLNQIYNQKVREDEVELYYKKYYQDRKSIISEVVLVIIFLFILYVLRRNGILSANLFNTFFSLTLFVFIFFRLTRRVIDLYRRDPRYYDEFIFDDPSFALTKPDFGATIPRLGKETYVCFINTISEQKTFRDLLDKLLGGNCGPSSSSNSCVKGRDLNNTFLELITDENYSMFWHDNDLNPKTLVKALEKVKQKMTDPVNKNKKKTVIDELIILLGMMGDVVKDYNGYYKNTNNDDITKRKMNDFVSNNIANKLTVPKVLLEEESIISQQDSCLDQNSVVDTPSASSETLNLNTDTIKKTKHNQRLLIAELVRRILNKNTETPADKSKYAEIVNKSEFINHDEITSTIENYPFIDALRKTAKSIIRNRIVFDLTSNGCYYYIEEEEDGDCSQKMRCFEFQKSFADSSDDYKKYLSSENMKEVHEGSVDSCPQTTSYRHAQFSAFDPTSANLDDYTFTSDGGKSYIKTNYSVLHALREKVKS